MMRRSLFSLALLIFLVPCAALHAQARLAIYGTAGGEKSGLPNQGWTTAETAGLYVGVANVGPLAFSADGRAELSSNVTSGLVGPRLAVHLPVMPIKPYAEVLVGYSDYSRTAAGLKPSNQFASRAVFGVDSAILPHVDWRIVDFSFGLNDSSNAGHAEALTTGLVVRF